MRLSTNFVALRKQFLLTIGNEKDERIIFMNLRENLSARNCLSFLQIQPRQELINVVSFSKCTMLPQKIFNFFVNSIF